LAGSTASAESSVADASEPFRYCLNTATIRGTDLGIVKAVEIAAQAGYTGIEPWMREIDPYVEAGGSLADLAKRIADHGLVVESAIGFAHWIADDPSERTKGLDDAKRAMEKVRGLGGRYLAAPPAGEGAQAAAPDEIARRYRVLLDVGQQMDVTPQLEIWGFSRSIRGLGQAAYVAIESGHADACLLPDVYHIYKGGSDFNGLKVISGTAIHCFHINDYPAIPDREKIDDAHRVYPGDGIAPLDQVVCSLKSTGFRGAISLELFNRDYWKRDPLEVARTGLEKTRNVVRTALAD